MYDGNFFDNVTHHMLLYDVGFNALYANDCKYLIKLINILNQSYYNNVVEELQYRYDFIITGLETSLWNNEYNIYINKFVNNTFYPRISPTLLYPLLTGEPTLYQAEVMVQNYLLNTKYFCINVNFPLLQPRNCYWGLPSIAFSDPAYSEQNYWRGLVWGPMGQIVYWSLINYIHNSTLIYNATRALTNQFNLMFLNIWNDKHHICENYSPHFYPNISECTGTKFYHWGGLAAYISFQFDEATNPDFF